MALTLQVSCVERVTIDEEARTEIATIRVSFLDTSDFPHVDLYVNLLGNSAEPIEGLAAGQVAVVEDGTFASITDFSSLQQQPINAALVIDRSNSMNEAGKVGAVKDAAIEYVNQMRGDDKTALIVFNHVVEPRVAPTSDKNLLISEVQGIQATGETVFYDAVYDAVQRLAAVQGRRYVVALTDGMDNRSQRSPDEVAQLARETGVQIHTIGLGDPKAPANSDAGLDEGRLASLAEQAGGQYRHVGPGEIADLYRRVARQTQYEYRVRFTSPRPEYDGSEREVTVIVSDSASQVLLPFSYQPGGLIPFEAQLSPDEEPPVGFARGPASADWWFVGLLAGLVATGLMPGAIRISRGLKRYHAFRSRSIRIIKPGDAYLVAGDDNRHICLADKRPFAIGERIVICPIEECSRAHHLECWVWIANGCAGRSEFLPCPGRGFAGPLRFPWRLGVE